MSGCTLVALLPQINESSPVEKKFLNMHTIACMAEWMEVYVNQAITASQTSPNCTFFRILEHLCDIFMTI